MPYPPDTYEDDHSLALWFTPQAVYEQVDPDNTQDQNRDCFGDVERFVQNADLDTLRAIGRLALQDDVVWNAFHHAIPEAAHAVMRNPQEFVERDATPARMVVHTPADRAGQLRAMAANIEDVLLRFRGHHDDAETLSDTANSMLAMASDLCPESSA